MAVTKNIQKIDLSEYKITADDIKLALLEYCRFKRQWIAVDECLNADIVADTGSYIVEIEVKISKSDLINGEAKKENKHDNYMHLHRPDFIPNKYLFCVPIDLKDEAVEYAKKRNPKYGVIVFDDKSYLKRMSEGKGAVLTTYLETIKSSYMLHDNYNEKHVKQIAKRASCKLITYMQNENALSQYSHVKDQRIVILVDEDEKAELEGQATEKGFDTVAAYMRWLIRQDK